MKEIRKIEMILTTLKVKKPVPADIRKRILMSKDKSFDMIVAKGLGNTSVISMKEFSSDKSEKEKKQTGGIMKKLSLIGGMVAVIAVVAGVYFYTNQSTNQGMAVKDSAGVEKATVTFVVGNAKLKRGASEATNIAIGDKILKNDVITTADNTNVTLQVADTGVVRVLENSEFTFNAIKENGATEISLAQGSVFSKVNKIRKGNSFKVKTPLCIAAVRGTEFLSTYENNNSEVQVLGGKVAVDSIDGNKENIVDGNNGVRIDGKELKLNGYKLNKIQKAILEKYSQADYIDDLDSKTNDELKSIGEGVQKKEDILNDKIKQMMAGEKVSPLDKLRNMGKPLTMLYLRDGSQIAGSIVSSNEKAISLDTGEGVISIPTEEVRRRMMIK